MGNSNSEHSSGLSSTKANKLFQNVDELNPTEDELQAVVEYTHKGDAPVNLVLRGKRTATRSAATRSALLDDLFQRARPTRQDATVFRVMTNCMFLARFKPGEKFVLDGFVSCTGDFEMVRPRIMLEKNRTSPTRCVLIIRVPSGSFGLDLSTVSKYPFESEVLLPRSSVFKLVRKSVDRSSIIVVAVFEVVLVAEPKLLPVLSLEDKEDVVIPATNGDTTGNSTDFSEEPPSKISA